MPPLADGGPRDAELVREFGVGMAARRRRNDARSQGEPRSRFRSPYPGVACVAFVVGGGE